MLSLPFSIFGQGISIKIERNIAYNANESYDIDAIYITNVSDDSIVIWLDNSDLHGRDSFIRYFNKKHNDFSIFMMLAEYGSTLTFDKVAFNPILYETFYKLIKPHDGFCIITNEGHADLIRSQIRSQLISNYDFYNTLSYSGTLILIN